MSISDFLNNFRYKRSSLIVLIVVLTAGIFFLWKLAPSLLPSAFLPDAAKLAHLPARPADIEAHGELARTVLAPDQARLKNANVPFAAGPLEIPKPFIFKGMEEDRLRAIQCLSTAILYEAGDDAEGEAAVAQVILNRVRHPAFPGTICGVVYQGAGRSTGCQFTFACDGSLRRVMPDATWRRARAVAEQALSGKVASQVGLATHYHTDWVYPYWSPELRKLARVGTHLFFGWPGSWGGPRAFQRKYQGGEPETTIPAIAAQASAEPSTPEDVASPRLPGLPLPPAQLPPGMGTVPLYGNRLRLVRVDGRAFGLLTPPTAEASSVINAAIALCSKPGPCEVAAWSNEDDIPGEYPIPAGARETMVFEYARNGAGSKGVIRFDCKRFPNKDAKLCR